MPRKTAYVGNANIKPLRAVHRTRGAYTAVFGFPEEIRCFRVSRVSQPRDGWRKCQMSKIGQAIDWTAVPKTVRDKIRAAYRRYDRMWL